MHKYRFIVFAVCFLAYSVLSAQIELVTPRYNHILQQTKTPVQKRSVSLDTLPFVEDFATGGPFPNSSRWEDNDVFVNNSLAIAPPSIGVATLDGLDETGSPYGRSESGDTLTSVAINLDVVVDDLHLSFFVQPRGFGDQPELLDSLILEFLDVNGVWQLQRSYQGSDTPLTVDEFMFDFVMISNTDFLHEDFQFRFRNKSSGRGAVDYWHLDMIRLLNNQAPSSSFRDVAFRFPSEGILDRYSAMPVRHFRSNTASHLRDMFSLSIINHFDSNRPIGSPTSLMEINEVNSGQNVLAPRQYLTGGQNIDSNTSIENTISQSFSVSSTIANSSDELLFETSFVLNPAEADNDKGHLENNFITTETVIDDYFAYDDGTAELGLLAQGAGTNIAVEFQTTVQDTLSAIALHIPRLKTDVSNQFFSLKVWLNDLTSEPVFEGNLLHPIYVDEFADTLQGFTTYRLQETFTGVLRPVEIPANTTFYIGWEQVSDEFIDAIPVGFDVNTTGVSQYNFFSTDEQDWFDFESENLDGALLIRPVMGVDNAIFTSVGETDSLEGIKVYPNPNNTGLLNIELDEVAQSRIKEARIIDVNGRLVHVQKEGLHQIALPYVAAGVYFINFADDSNNLIYREKLIIQE